MIQNSNGTYAFYTRGVDRITVSFDSMIAENSPIDTFANPDALWNSFKDKIFDFVQDHGGNAQPVSPAQNKIYRPDWNKVRQVLKGQRPISDLGCN